MVVTSKLSSGIAALIESLPRGRIKATKLVRSLRALNNSPSMWDPWILKDGDIYRLFYLYNSRLDSSGQFWTQGTIYGAISTDLYNWKSIGVVLEPDPANAWESGRMLAGNTYKEDEIYYLFYSAAGSGAQLYDERIGLATSVDGLTWRRYSSAPLMSEDDYQVWYGKQKDVDRWHWRDPFILKDVNSSKYYMFISAYSKNGTLADLYQGCVGLAVAEKITGPYKVLPPVAGPLISGIEDWPFIEIERPQIIYRQGKYHLFFSCWPWQLNPKWTRKFNHRFRESSLYWFVSDSIHGPFKPASELPIVKGSENTPIYATNFLSVTDNSDEFMAIGWYHRIVSLQIKPLFKAYFEDELIEIRKA